MNAQERPYETRPLRLKPIISYPRQAEVGKMYLMSIDVQLDHEEGNSNWPYPEEEYAISFILNLQPYFSYAPLGGREPTVVLHRFGGTYGPAEYRLTAADHGIGPGRISITFVNGWGLPITHLNLACEIRQKVQADPASQLLLVAMQRPASQKYAEQMEIPGRQPGGKSVGGDHHMTPELQHAVDLVREQLLQTGWRVQRETSVDWSGAQGVAVRDYPYSTDDIPTFMLQVDGVPVGLVDVRLGNDVTEESGTQARARAGKLLSNNSTDLTTGILAKMLPFVYESDGVRTRYISSLEPPEAGNRQIFTFHRPETLKRWIDEFPTHTRQMTENNLLRSRLRHLPEQPIASPEPPVREALSKLEQALAESRSRVLLRVSQDYDVSMLAIPGIYRLLKFGGARRILYLTGETGGIGNDTPMDSKTLFSERALRAHLNASKYESTPGARVAYIREQFARYIVPDEGRSMRHIYTIESLSVLPLDAETHVFIATMPQLAALLNATPGQVAYRQDLPIEAFDLVFVDDARLCIQPDFLGVSHYFDAPLVGFESEDDLEVHGFFGGKAVYTLQTTLQPATVLISYASEQKEAIAFLRRSLPLRGIRVLLDTLLSEEEPFLAEEVFSPENITKLIEAANSMLLFYTSPSQPATERDILAMLESRYPKLSNNLPGVIDRLKTMQEHGTEDNSYYLIVPLQILPTRRIFRAPTSTPLATIVREITSRTISSRQSTLTPTPGNEIGVHFRTFPPTPPVGEHALDIDWSTYCADRWPTEDEWVQELLSALEDVKDALKEQSISTLRCYINARMSAAFLFGVVFSRQADFTLLLTEQSNTWSTNATEINASLIQTELERRTPAVDEAHQGQDSAERDQSEEDSKAERTATIEISVSNTVTEDVTSYLDEQALPCRYRLHVQPGSEASRRSLEGANEALTLAWQVRRAVENLHKSHEIAHIHLFCSLRHRLAVLLGHYLQGLGVTITFYDFDTKDRRYLPMYTLSSGYWI